ncbi:hypothetical protein [Bryobacter aggregatus]|uniref:hypothetical protein n=1 Tax=Bryobacter aggregatus TaxID=360054 RepID=UPI0004E18E2B|nr:hypothetical protein [Bryobacter aggregatus]
MLQRCIAGLLCIATTLSADARYQLAYQVKANLLVQLGARVAGLSKLNSSGETVLLKGAKILVKGDTSTLIVDYATSNVVILDHTDKTFERVKIEEMRQRIAADFPTALVDGLKKLFGGDGSSSTSVERVGDGSAMPSLARFRAKYGLGYLLPAMETLTPLAPGIEKGLQSIRGQNNLPLSLRISMGAKVMDATVQIQDYQESAVQEHEFAVPPGYQEIKAQ